MREPAGDRFPHPLDDEPSVPARVSRRAAHRRAHLSQAGFAALATIAMAAMTVIAAARGGARLHADPEVRGQTPAVAPIHETVGGRSPRETIPRGVGPRAVPRGTTTPITPATVLVTATRTVSVPEVNGEYEEPRPEHPHPPHAPQGAENPSGEDEPQPCADTTAKGGKDCPATPGNPKPSFTQIPQTGDGESTGPSPAVSASSATPAPSPSAGPSLQLGD
ncbi:hypothetical protein AB0395_38385 [Streptosporangium sp. NPDC051023]|uniref:hypothetical protein n=1 Tax=Streptosporangium sp. NPDC051023 TaxID=3155410 RepID=UPI00344FC3D6